VKADCNRARRGKTGPKLPATGCPPLAHAFLALADDDGDAGRRTLPRRVAAAGASVVLALGGPLGWLAVKPSQQPVAALASKFSLSADDE
jgi:hypothetical protein